MISRAFFVYPRRCCVLLLGVVLGGAALAQSSPETGRPSIARNRLFFVGDTGETRLRDAHVLSNGDLLITGATRDLAWTGSAPRTAWPAPAARPAVPAGQLIGFVLVASPDLQSLRHVYHFPPGAVDEVTRVRSTEVPGRPTGMVFLSGRFPHIQGDDDGYWISRLEGDASAFSTGRARPLWSRFVNAQGFRVNKATGRSEGEYARSQPWDVRSDGRVIYAEGAPYWDKWSALRVFEADGSPGGLPAWREEGGARLLPLKPGRAGSLRSTTQADFDHRQPDENDNPGRKGRYPDDYYFTGPADTRGRGYTGYRAVGTTQRVSPLAIDRRDNSLYFGTSTQTRLPDGKPDFEPAFIRLDADGRLVWWARGYRDIERSGENAEKHQDGLNSPPDQYVDQVALDYKNDRVFFLARAHGGGVINYWSGNQIVRNQPHFGFLNNLHDTGDVHVSWLGAYDLREGKIHHSTWVAELAAGARNLGAVHTDGPLAGWPRPNKGWTNQTTTQVHDLAVTPDGRPALLGVGRHPYTTRYALIENVKPGQGVSPWSHFARIYSANLRTLAYSTLLRGPWDVATGKNAGDSLNTRSLTPLANGLLVVGDHTPSPEGVSAPPAALAVPSWGLPAPAGSVASGFVALLVTDEDDDGPAEGNIGGRPRSLY